MEGGGRRGESAAFRPNTAPQLVGMLALKQSNFECFQIQSDWEGTSVPQGGENRLPVN